MKIVCLGDSFTKGFGVKENENWVALLSDSSEHTFINKGINGDTTGGMLGRFYHDVVLEKPNYVLISGGINDFICSAELTAVQPNMMALAHQAFQNGIIPVIGIEPPFIPEAIRSDWRRFTDFDLVLKKHDQYHDWLLRFAKTFGLSCINFYKTFSPLAVDAPLSDYYLDGLHLTASGHRLIFSIAENHFK